MLLPMRPTTVQAAVILVACQLSVVSSSLAQEEESSPASGDRSVDLQLHPIVSFPNLLGLCVEAFPGSEDKWSSTTCASIGVIGVGPNTNVQYRWSLYEGETLSLSAGPGIGPRLFLSYKQGGTARPAPGESPEREADEFGVVAIWADAFASLEAAWWGDRFGFTAQLDLGATRRLVEYESTEAGPHYVLANFTVGLAIR
jgi:hypothetical protein